MRILTLFAALALLASCGHKDRPKKHPRTPDTVTNVDEQGEASVTPPPKSSDPVADVAQAEKSLAGDKLNFETKGGAVSVKLPPYLFELQSEIPDDKIGQLAHWQTALSLYAHTANTFIKTGASDSKQAAAAALKRDAAQKAADFLEARLALADLKKQKKKLAEQGLQFHVIYYPGQDTRNEEILSDVPSNLAPADLVALQDKLNLFTKAADTLANNAALNDKQFFTQETMADMLRKESALARQLVLKITDEQTFASYGVKLYEQDDAARLFNFEVDASVLTFLSPNSPNSATSEEVAKGALVAQQLEAYSNNLTLLAASGSQEIATASLNKAKAAAQASALLKYRVLADRFGKAYGKLVKNISYDTTSGIVARWVQTPSDVADKSAEMKTTRNAYSEMTKFAKEPILVETMKTYQANSTNTTSQRRTDILQQAVCQGQNDAWLAGYEPALAAIEKLLATPLTATSN